MGDHGNRTEDIGWGRIIKYWPLLVGIFTAGAWYQSSVANNRVTEIIQVELKDHDNRLTRVEDAVVYLKELVALKRAGR